MKTIKLILLIVVLVLLFNQSCYVLINPQPYILVMQDLTDIPSGSGVFDFGDILVGYSSSEIAFTIINIGNSKLTLVESLDIILKNGGDSDDFSINQTATQSELSPKKSTTFTVTFTPNNTGLRSTTLSLMNIDSVENPYNFLIKGTGVTPEIDVKQGSVNMISGYSSFDFGSVTVENSSSYIAFEIENWGTSDLFLYGFPDLIEIRGTNENLFSIEQNSTASTIKPAESTEFSIVFRPKTAGVKNAIISITNSDLDENVYTYKIQGTGIEPNIVIQDSSENEILNSIGSFNFGILKINLASVQEFTIKNVGLGFLELTGSPKVVIAGSGASAFSVTVQPTSPIQHNRSSTFKIEFKPTTQRLYLAAVSIANSDSHKNPYTFTIAGSGIIANTDFDFNDDGIDDVLAGARFDDDGESNSGCVFIFFGNATPPSSIDASNADVKLIGEDGEDYFCIVSSAGDYNNDGFDDVIVGADSDDDGGSNSGCAFIFFGSASPPSNIDASNANVKFIGEDSLDQFGYSVSNAGDINNDGFDDVIVGAPFDNDNGNYSGCAFIFFGSSNPSPTIDASNANVKLTGSNANNWFGYSVSFSGDFDNDGIEDIIVGAPKDDDGGVDSGCAFVFFGRSNWNSSIDSSNADVKFIGENAGDRFAWSVSSAGDINNDGFCDIIVGAYNDDDGGSNSGCAFVFIGSSNPTSTVDASNADVKIIGEEKDDHFGASVSSVGDFNNDGYDDVIVGAFMNDAGGSNSGSSYIIYGQQNLNLTIDASIADVKLVGGDTNNHFGWSVSTGGDFNNDGYNDVIVGARFDDAGGHTSGCAYIFIGSSSPVSTIDAIDANVKLIGEDESDFLGWSVAGGR